VTIVWGALAGGAVGATIVASGVRLAQELGWTRMDIPFLLGTMLTENRRAAGVAGGFMLFNYGRSTMAITLVLQLAFGAIVGAFAAGL
jgi:hypothetical protein